MGKSLLIFITMLVSSSAWARSVYLNGIDISSARHQSMKNVNIRIDGDGNLFIEGVHYQVNEENTYYPLSSSARPDLSLPTRKGEINPELAKSAPTQAEPGIKTAPIANGQPAPVEVKKDEPQGAPKGMTEGAKPVETPAANGQ